MFLFQIIFFFPSFNIPVCRSVSGESECIIARNGGQMVLIVRVSGAIHIESCQFDENAFRAKLISDGSAIFTETKCCGIGWAAFSGYALAVVCNIWLFHPRSLFKQHCFLLFFKAFFCKLTFANDFRLVIASHLFPVCVKQLSVGIYTFFSKTLSSTFYLQRSVGWDL